MASVGKQGHQPYSVNPCHTSSSFHYLPALDGWRAVSILLVLISHAGLGHIVPGGLGVTIFFFISGYLITSLLIIELKSFATVSVKNFYLRRFWRLFPPAATYIILSVWFIYLATDKFVPAEILSSVFYFANYYSIYWHYESLSFAPSPLEILWSLAIEEQYYLFFAPAFAYFSNTQRKLLILILILIIIPFLIRCQSVFGGDGDFINNGYTYMATEARIDSIAWGGALAWICNRYSPEVLNTYLSNKVTVGISLLIILFCLLFRNDSFRESVRYTLQGIALIPLFYASLYNKSFAMIHGILSQKSLVFIGKLSYSIYLYHWLALVLTCRIIGKIELAVQWQLCYYGLTFFMAIASYKLIEVPSLMWRKKYGSMASS